MYKQVDTTVELGRNAALRMLPLSSSSPAMTLVGLGKRTCMLYLVVIVVWILMPSACNSFFICAAATEAAFSEPAGAGNRRDKRKFTSPEDASATPLFRTVDVDRDGYLEVNEIRAFLENTVGGVNFDSADEIEQGTTDALENVLDVDLDRSGDINPRTQTKHAIDAKKLAAYWRRLGREMSVGEVRDWVKYGVQLGDDVATAFRTNRVTGYDFPALLENDGSVLRTDLQITSTLDRKRLVRALRMMLLGIADRPSRLPSATCMPVGALSHSVQMYLAHVQVSKVVKVVSTRAVSRTGAGSVTSNGVTAVVPFVSSSSSPSSEPSSGLEVACIVPTRGQPALIDYLSLSSSSSSSSSLAVFGLRIAWSHDADNGIPTHLYRVQRRLVNGDAHVRVGGGFNDKFISANHERELREQWITISTDNSQCILDLLVPSTVTMSGQTDTSEPEFKIAITHDEAIALWGLDGFRSYEYRVQAWNGMGHSLWTDVQMSMNPAISSSLSSSLSTASSYTLYVSNELAMLYASKYASLSSPRRPSAGRSSPSPRQRHRRRYDEQLTREERMRRMRGQKSDHDDDDDELYGYYYSDDELDHHGRRSSSPPADTSSSSSSSSSSSDSRGFFAWILDLYSSLVTLVQAGMAIAAVATVIWYGRVFGYKNDFSLNNLLFTLGYSGYRYQDPRGNDLDMAGVSNSLLRRQTPGMGGSRFARVSQFNQLQRAQRLSTMQANLQKYSVPPNVGSGGGGGGGGDPVGVEGGAASGTGAGSEMSSAAGNGVSSYSLSDLSLGGARDAGSSNLRRAASAGAAGMYAHYDPALDLTTCCVCLKKLGWKDAAEEADRAREKTLEKRRKKEEEKRKKEEERAEKKRKKEEGKEKKKKVKASKMAIKDKNKDKNKGESKGEEGSGDGLNGAESRSPSLSSVSSLTTPSTVRPRRLSSLGSNDVDGAASTSRGSSSSSLLGGGVLSSILGWRFKHICHRCHRAFCHKHGRSTHSRFTPCGVPGNCCCSNCLREIRSQYEAVEAEHFARLQELGVTSLTPSSSLDSLSGGDAKKDQ